MDIIEIEKSVTIADPTATVTIATDHTNVIGTESYHIVDIPDNDNYFDFEWSNEGNAIIGIASKFIGKRVIIFSKAVNIKKDVKDIKLNYLVNGDVCYAHVNSKAEEPSPSIMLTISFTS